MSSDTRWQVLDARRHSFAIVDNEVVTRHGPAIGCHGLAVYLALAVMAGEDGAAVVYQSTLAKRSGVSVRKLRDVLSLLEAEGLVAVEQRRRDGSKQQLASRYRLLPVAKSRHETDQAARGAGGSDQAARGAAPPARGAAPPARGAEYVQDVLSQDVSSQDGGETSETSTPASITKAPTGAWPSYVPTDRPELLELLAAAGSVTPKLAWAAGRVVDGALGEIDVSALAAHLRERGERLEGPGAGDALVKIAEGFRVKAEATA